MNSKQLLFSIMLLTVTGNNIFAMDEMTCHRASGYWHRLHTPFKETSKENQREPWHCVSNYVAEPFCAASTVPFFLAAYAVKDSNPLSAGLLAFAGSASAISHTIPYQFLNNI